MYTVDAHGESRKEPNVEAGAIRQACMTEPRIDTHAHLSENYPHPREQAANHAHFATTQGLIDSRVAAEGCRTVSYTHLRAHET